MTLLSRSLLFVVVLLVSSRAAFSQTMPAPAADQPHHHHAAESLFEPREASGTAWLPAVTPMYGVMRTWGGWQVMLHGNVFGQFLYEPGDVHRTGGFATKQASSVNWGMLHARRPVGVGRFGVRAMVSAEPWTVSDCGYLNFLATGEMCDSDTIHDRQHPHDLFMELAADYDRPLSGAWRWQVYAGLSGEPALGPVGFPHRVSSMSNPVAPITHHWLDATHIAFGLITTGIYDRRWKAEVSLFNGREPDEDRADLDLAALDSISGRISFLPSEAWAFQLSAGHLTEAEAEFPPQPRADMNRLTASATYHSGIPGDGVWATTLAYGLNSGREIIPGEVLDAVTHALLLESTATIGERHTWFARGEIVGKPAHDLHAHEYGASIFAVGKLQGGYVRQLKPWRGIVSGLGGTMSLIVLPPELASRYDGRVAPGFGIFVTARPARHSMKVTR